MQLIGMLDSPYVRRVAVSLQLLELPFVHRSISVFSTFDQFHAINPVVKAPSLVCDDGTVLMDSTLILEYAESLVGSDKSLMPHKASEYLLSLRIIGLALAACDKSVQIIYEHSQRPPEKVYEPWMARVSGQLLAACQALETELARVPLAIGGARMNQAGVTTAVTWHFIQKMLPEMVPSSRFPTLQRFTIKAEELPEFAAAPHGSSTYQDSALIPT